MCFEDCIRASARCCCCASAANSRRPRSRSASGCPRCRSHGSFAARQRRWPRPPSCSERLSSEPERGPRTHRRQLPVRRCPICVCKSQRLRPLRAARCGRGEEPAARVRPGHFVSRNLSPTRHFSEQVVIVVGPLARAGMTDSASAGTAPSRSQRGPRVPPIAKIPALRAITSGGSARPAQTPLNTYAAPVQESTPIAPAIAVDS